MSSQHAIELEQGRRFPFGDNWRKWLSTLSDAQIEEAQDSLKQMLDVADLSGMSFLDIGCGSGLFSLAARLLGAKVYSFDYDPKSVECAKDLKRRYAPGDEFWQIHEGSVLDEQYVRSLGGFDIVYSWGVLHHTGNMLKALNLAMIPVKRSGKLHIAIYNDQGVISKIWAAVKRIYCSNKAGKYVILGTFIPTLTLLCVAISLIKYKSPLRYFVTYKKRRGMSVYYDWIDWLGGYPFEVATPEAIFHFYRNAGFRLDKLITTNRLGCNQFVFQRSNGEHKCLPEEEASAFF